MKKIQFLSLALVCVGVMNAQSLDKGLSMMKDEQYEQAKSFFAASMKQSPSAEAAYQLGEAYYNLGQVDSAAIAYQGGSILNPKYSCNFSGLAKIDLTKGNTASAKVNFDKARKVAKKDIKQLLEISNAAIAPVNKDTATARQILVFVTDINPKSPELYLASGDFYLAIRNTGQAINEYNNAIYYNADKAEVAYRLGNLYTRLRKFKDAETNYKKVLEVNPNAILAYKKLGDLYYMYGKYADAKASYVTYFSKAQVSESDKEKYALILFFNKNYDETEKLISEISSSNKDNAVLYRIRAYSAYERGDYQKGTEFINQFFTIQKPEKVIALDYDYNAKILLANKDTLGATKNFMKAFELDTNRFQSVEDAGKLFTKLKKHQEAVSCYKLMERNPQQDKATTSYLMGKEYYTWAGEQTDAVQKVALFQKADSSFTTVTKLSPKFTAGYLWKARSLASVDPDAKTDNAKVAYEAVVNNIQASGKADDNNLKEAYLYFASYNYLQYEKEKSSTAKASFKQSSIDYFQKVLTIDPANKQASEALKILK